MLWRVPFWEWGYSAGRGPNLILGKEKPGVTIFITVVMKMRHPARCALLWRTAQSRQFTPPRRNKRSQEYGWSQECGASDAQALADLGERGIGGAAAVREEQGGHRLVAAVDLLDQFGGTGYVLDVDLLVADALAVQLGL